MSLTLFDSGTAVISDDGLYRYDLTRRWGDGHTVTWIMLNPSTADATADDPTIRRCIGFAKRWGYAGINVANVFALRSADPAALTGHPDPVGPDNDAHLRRLVNTSYLTMAAWGAAPVATDRVRRLLVLGVLPPALYCLGVTAAGHPRHPLYVPGARQPEPGGPS